MCVLIYVCDIVGKILNEVSRDIIIYYLCNFGVRVIKVSK